MLDEPPTSLSAGAMPPSNPSGLSSHLFGKFEGGDRAIDELEIWPMQNDIVDYYEELLNDNLSNSVRFWPQPTELGDDVNDVDQLDGFLLFANDNEEGGADVNLSADTPTYPWPSIQYFLTDLLFSSPRLRFSVAQKMAVLSWARQLGAQGVPTLRGLQKAQEYVRNLLGNPTKEVTAYSGNIFHINDVGAAIAK
ncbi:hypothetical protein AX14_008084, partial [Amanita brunnescens Koide BX004]